MCHNSTCCPGHSLFRGHAGAEAEDREPADRPGPLRWSNGVRPEQGEGEAKVQTVQGEAGATVQTEQGEGVTYFHAMSRKYLLQPW